jgi:hypothetical protein
MDKDTHKKLPICERLIASMTEPQKRAILALSETPKRARRYGGFNAQAAFNLVRHGIVALGFDMGALVDTYYLTPLGLEVQAALRARNEQVTK